MMHKCMLLRLWLLIISSKILHFSHLNYCPSDLDVDMITGTFTDSVGRFCHAITVQNNDLAEETGIATLMIVNTTLESAQFGTRSVTINIMDDECKWLCYSYLSNKSYTIHNYNTVVTVALEQAAYTIPEGGSATLLIALDGNLHQHSTIPVRISVVENTANGKYHNILYRNCRFHVYNFPLLA